MLSPLLSSLIALFLTIIGFAHAGEDGLDIGVGISIGGVGGTPAHHSTSANIRKFDLNITLTQLNPDCNASFVGPVINGQFPAPAIHVVKNDIVQFHVYNDPSHNFSSSIHIHGIRQFGTNRADGVAGITQLAIGPGETFVQQFQVLNQSGTFYYHAHVGVQDDTIQGPFIVHEDQEALNNHAANEIVLQWAEWWHQSFHDRFSYYMSPAFVGDGGPDSILLNGRSIYANTSAARASPDCKGFTYFDVEPNKTYLVRTIGALTFRTLGIAVQGHNMTLVEIDGEPVQPHQVDYIELSAGQRMAFTITTGDHAAGSVFPIVTHFRYRGQGLGYTPNGYGFLRYAEAASKQDAVSFLTTPLVKDLPADVFPLVDTPGWFTSELKPASVHHDEFILAEPATRTIKITSRETKLPDNTTRFITNNRTYVAQPWGNATMSLIDKVLAEPVGALDPTDRFSVAHQTFVVKLGEIIDLVFQNVQLPATGNCVLHPWHTHGHSHYLIAEGPGDYNHETDKDIRTYSGPLYRDVSIVYPRIDVGTTGVNNCGWTKVRLFTDNPGVWPIHCHITAHMLQGKMVVMEVSPEALGEDKFEDAIRYKETNNESKDQEPEQEEAEQEEREEEPENAEYDQSEHSRHKHDEHQESQDAMMDRKSEEQVEEPVKQEIPEQDE